MDCHQKIELNTLKLSFSGRFTFQDHLLLKTLSKKIVEEQIRHVEIDMENLQFIDSAALGMLLILNETTKNNNGILIVEKLQGQVMRVFTAAQMAKLISTR